MKKTKLMLGDNIESLRKLPDNSIDSVVTDPPYGLSFMNKKWDHDVPSIEFWREVYRVLKPGGHVLSFGGTRTYHRMVVNIEDAGFEIRDQIMWLYGSGFPKSHNIGKAVDKIQGNERVEWLDEKKTQPNIRGNGDQLLISASGVEVKDREPIKHSKGKSQYEGWGTAMKPSVEPICVARKSLSEKSVAENVLKWGTGGINIDGCRVATDDKLQKLHNEGNKNVFDNSRKEPVSTGKKIEFVDSGEGRFPANIILDEIAGELLDEQSGVLSNQSKSKRKGGFKTEYVGGENVNKYETLAYSDKGGASRFFYQAKVSKAERNMGLDDFEETTTGGKGHGLDRKCSHCNTSMLKPEDCKCEEPDWITPPKKNSHPTVKPVSLMSYLCRLITPPNGIVLDPFMGSGSTGIAAQLEGFRFCGMEMDADYFKIAEARIENYEQYRKFIK